MASTTQRRGDSGMPMNYASVDAIGFSLSDQVFQATGG
jgi:hypothetical protein